MSAWPKGAFVATALVAGCAGYESEYERNVAEHEPVYCYHSLGDATCYKEPRYRDRRQLVNYYGPHPRRYDAPEPPAPMNLDAPPRVKQYYRDPEPIPGPPEAAASAKGDDAAAAKTDGKEAPAKTKDDGDETLTTIIKYLPLAIGAAQIIAAFVF